MASPAPALNGTSTPPTQTQPSQPTPPTTQPSMISSDPSTQPNPALPSQPGTSLTDSGAGKRPRDARLIHLLLSNLGVKEYQDRVPLQLLDFAYRYTAGIMSDALALSAEGYGDNNTTTGAGGKRAKDSDEKQISVTGLRLATQSRAQYQFQGALPKEYLMDLAGEKNRVPLPRPGREFGVRLPPERYCLTGVGWGLRDEWESEGEEVDEDEKTDAQRQSLGGDVGMGPGVEGEEVDEDEMEEVMGVGHGGGDSEMGEG